MDGSVDPARLTVIVWCQNVGCGLHAIDRSTDYSTLLHFLSLVTQKSLSEYILRVSAKLYNGSTFQIIPITSSEVVSFFFQQFDMVELFVDVEAVSPPRSSYIPTQQPSTYVPTYPTDDSTQTSFDLNFPRVRRSSMVAEPVHHPTEPVRHTSTIPENEMCDQPTGPTDPDVSCPSSESSGEDEVVRVPRIPPHPVLSRAPYFTSSYEEVYVDSVGIPPPVFTYDPKVGELQAGMTFVSKDELKSVVKDYSIKHSLREYAVVESSNSKWKVICKQKSKDDDEQCGWYLRAAFGKKRGIWLIKAVGPPHSCLIGATNQRHYNLDRNLIAEVVAPFVKNKVDYSAIDAKILINQLFKYEVSYSLAWKGIRRAIENVYGTWESSCAYLPKFMGALKKYNPGTVVQWRHARYIPETGQHMLGYMFWAFKPVIDAWHQCRPVISVDGTHLYTKYRHKMLIAMGTDANKRILPIAFAIVDEESYQSWKWFLDCLCVHVTRGVRGVCLISDRHAGILKAVEETLDFCPPRGVHRYCLRHLASNVHKTHKSIQLYDMTWSAGTAPTEMKWRLIMDQIKELSIGAWNYLDKLDRAKWTVSHDEGYRFGILTTNISECFNSVLRGARRLPITAIVNATFQQSVETFFKREKDARRVLESNQKWPDVVVNSYNAAEASSLSMQGCVVGYNNTTYSASVTSAPMGSRRAITHVVTLSAQECSCGEWVKGDVPCVHALAVCRYFGYEPENFIHVYFRSQTYFATYTSAEFFPVGDEAEWDEPNFKLCHNPERRISRRGRPVTTRIHNEMDWAQNQNRRRYQANNRSANQGESSRRT